MAIEQSEERMRDKRIPVGRDSEGVGVPGPEVGAHLNLVYLSYSKEEAVYLQSREREVGGGASLKAV